MSFILWGPPPVDPAITVYMHQADLTGVECAGKILEKVHADTTEEIFVSHNSLGGDGCSALFKGLKSLKKHHGANLKLCKITLSANRIGNDGLEAMAAYLKGDTVMRELDVSNNAFRVSPRRSLLGW